MATTVQPKPFGLKATQINLEKQRKQLEAKAVAQLAKSGKSIEAAGEQGQKALGQAGFLKP